MEFNSKIKFKNFYSIFLLVVLLILTVFTVNNFLAVSKLQSQTKTIIANIPGGLKPSPDMEIINTQEELLAAFEKSTLEELTPEESALEEPALEEPQELTPTLTDSGQLITYSNIFSETFYNQYYINREETNLYFDEQVSALTFEPLYELVLKETCSVEDCGYKDERPDVYLEKNNWRFLGLSLPWPEEIKGKEIKAVFSDLLDKKYLVSFIVSENGQELVFSYFSDSRGRLTYLDTAPKMTTRIGYGNGYVSAGGSDEQFIIFYSGYEGLGLLYNKGDWQDLKQFFDLRVTSGGFVSKILKIGNDSEATWYLCSADKSEHFLKLWQNGTSKIQGALDLSQIFSQKPFQCFVENNQLYFIEAGKKYLFADQGFDNSHDYQYQSININNYKGKKIQQLHFLRQSINAAPGSYTLFASIDANNWQEVVDNSLSFTNKDSDQAFLRARFQAGDKTYSPWFGGLENVFYIAVD
ncbi:MAG: hypothetical protein ACOX6C_02550 [Patescibacteria group bacterium]|jgi:hypothetical protein